MKQTEKLPKQFVIRIFNSRTHFSATFQADSKSTSFFLNLSNMKFFFVPMQHSWAMPDYSVTLMPECRYRTEAVDYRKKADAGLTFDGIPALA
jgi:hypothetical protein